MASLALVATLWAWLAGGGAIDLPWAPTWNLRLSLRFDGLAALYAFLATGIGLAVLVYSSGYLPRHLAHQQQPPAESVRFYAFMLLFMGAMVGLVMARDLFLLFVFWDVTAIASYYLIGYDHHREEARGAALMALLVTGIAAVLFLIGALLLFDEYGTFSLDDLLARTEPGPLLTAAAGLMALAALAKCAQVPFHFWLPRAMAAPTPVSAYLHSAAMVAAGVFLLGRIYPLLATSRLLLDALLLVGLASLAAGGLLALVQDRLKRVLAYSTISQYGYVVLMYGLGSSAGVAGATFYVLAHALIKSSLFLAAGAVTEATGADRLSRLGGLRRSMPALAAASAASAAGLSALPLTLGFFKDELFFKAALEHGRLIPAVAVLGAALTLTYIGRFWGGIFGGSQAGEVERLPASIVAPVVILALVVVVGGIVPGPFVYLAEAAAASTWQAPVAIDVAYHLDARPENLMALAAYLLGALLLLFRGQWRSVVDRLAQAGNRLGPERWYETGLAFLRRASDLVYWVELRELANRVASILFPSALLIILGLVAAPTEGVYRFGELSVADLPLILALVLTGVAALLVLLPRDHPTQVFALTSVGYALAAAFALLGAPNVALVAVLVETLSTLFFVAILALLPFDVLARQVERSAGRWRQGRDAGIAVVTGLISFVVVWAVLSQPALGRSVAEFYVRLTPSAHAGNVVTAILADFRGLDTMGEITVLGIALLGLATLLRHRREK